MKCYICDKTLSQDEIKYSPKYGKGNFDPCFECLSHIEETKDPETEEELDVVFASMGDVEPDVLDDDSMPF